MTDRFIIDDAGELIDLNNHQFIDYGEECCNLLNELAEENRQLKKENEYLHKYNTKLQKQPLLFDVQTIPNTMEIMEANTKLEEENEQLKQDIENLKITINARETLIDVCEKKFKELGFIITVDDDGYVIE